MKKILLVGGTGYIGRHVLEHLLQAGHEVRLLIQEKEYDKPTVKELVESGVSLHIGDLTQPETLQGISDGMDAVVSMVGVRTRNQDLLRKVYVHGPTELARQATESGIRTFVYLSNITVYGDHRDDDVTEASVYKSSGELGRLILEAEEGVFRTAKEATILRLPAVFGGTFSSVMPSAVFIGEGGNWMNHVHVEDVAKMIDQLIDYPVPGVFHMSDGEPLRQQQAVELLALPTGKRPVNYTYEEARRKFPADVFHILTDSCRLNNDKLKQYYRHTPFTLAQYVTSIEEDREWN